MAYSERPFEAVRGMYERFGMLDPELDQSFVEYRLRLLTEEYRETMDAHEAGDAEEVVDGHLDMLVIILGNLELFGVDPKLAFDEVMRANMTKEPGVKASIDAAPSMVKPAGWEPPSHEGNHGGLDEVYGGEEDRSATIEAARAEVESALERGPGLFGPQLREAT